MGSRRDSWARRRSTVADRAARLQEIRRAVKHNFPTADVEQMLAEIELIDSEGLADFDISTQIE